ncbi:c-type cytochrome biogenesis protein CcsB [Desulfatirhabdium butyrativorans]|uniref:c-type cytochrome biogenesis protein CcsB n=1 Tax=Desulfatirhabdium butyrativorans TaxID=340467 RepID=UPI0004863F9E|nr:c-type cytochrome biogenesis protein CcsB [Desulfatirhabdium butyrativorans]
MNSSLMLSIVTFVYAAAAVLYVASWVFRKSLPATIATWVSLLGLIGNVAGIAMRWIESYQMGIGHAPLSNLYESLVFYSAVITLLYLVIERRYETPVIGAFSMPLAFLAMAYASLSPNVNDRIQPLLPALKSNWLIAHVITCFIGYAAFAIAFGLSLMYVLKARHSGDGNSLIGRFPDIRILDELNHQMIMFGFLFLTAGIITGSVWANSAWGRYWGWDPKETWSLITWFIYATLLHARFMRGWQGMRIAYLSMAGFAAVLFTYFGVNLLPGLHSYGSMGQ